MNIHFSDGCWRRTRNFSGGAAMETAIAVPVQALSHSIEPTPRHVALKPFAVMIVVAVAPAPELRSVQYSLESLESSNLGNTVEMHFSKCSGRHRPGFASRFNSSAERCVSPPVVGSVISNLHAGLLKAAARPVLTHEVGTKTNWNAVGI